MEINKIDPRYPKIDGILKCIMRTLVLLFCVATFGLTPKESMSQRIMIDADKTVSVDEVFRIIKSQTKDYMFIYHEGLLKDLPKVELKKGSIRMDKLINKSLSKANLNVVVTKNNTILIKERKKSEQQQVSGTVTDENGTPIPGVTVMVKGTTLGTATDFDGNYQITVPSADHVLVFTSIGFTTQEITVGQRTTINVQIKEGVQELHEVVLNAGYYSVTEKERTGSIEKVTAVEIEKQPISNPLAALQGRMAGVEIQQTSGLPGANFNIRIRGRNSIRSEGNDPLYIIDGVPFSSATLGEPNASVSLPGQGISPLNSINPNDIESIEVLKDADATAIYGSRGANGVVLITTKKGRAGTTDITLNIFSGMGNVTNTMELLSTPEYLEIRRESYANDGVEPIPANAYDINGTWDTDRYTDWQKELFGRTSYLTNVQGTLSGGSQQTQFLISGNFNGQTDVLPGDHHSTKVSGLANLSHKTKDGRFSAQLSTNYVSHTNDLPYSVSLVLEGLLTPPNAPELLDENGGLNWENSTWQNPLRHLESTYRSSTTTFIGNARLVYKLFSKLELIANLGYIENHLNEDRIEPSTRYNPAFGRGSEFSYVIQNMGRRTSWIVEPQLSWNHDFGDTRISALVGSSFQEQFSDRLSLRASGFSSNSLIGNIAAATTLDNIADVDQTYRYHAIFGRLNLNHKGRYILNLTGRRDGSSRFGPDRRFSNFGAVGLAWIFSEEALIRRALPFLSFGKFKGSYGTSGNDQIGDYQYLDTYSFGSLQYQNEFGLYPTRLFNPDFSWERNKKVELSLELGLFGDRIFFTGNYFRNRSSNQLVGTPLPATTGFPSISGNLAATVENQGWELEFSTLNLNTGKVRWSTSINLTIPKNKLVAFPDLEGSTYANELVVGEPLDIRKLYRLSGVDTDTGLYEFNDFNGDGEITSVDDRQVVKSFSPEFFGGINNTLSIGKFQLDLLFQFSKQMGWNFWREGSIPGSVANQPKAVLDHWQTVGDMATVQRMSLGNTLEPLFAYFNHRSSDAAVSDASYLRLKTLSLSYMLSQKGKSGIGCEIYARGQNLWTLTDYFGLDPETLNNQTVPTLRVISLGTRLTF